MKDADTLVLPRLGVAETGIEDPWDEHPVADPRPAAARWSTDTPSWRRAAWLVPALLMGLLGAVRAGTPGLRTAELVTWRAATAPDWTTPADWAGWSRLAGGDGVSTPYHLLMRAWVTLFGTSDLALRMPSVLAMTAAAALLGALAARTLTPAAGTLAGVIFALVPTATRYAQEAGPYALTTLAAVLATWRLLAAVDRPDRRRLAGYAAAVALLGLCHVPALLLLVGHGWLVVAFRRPVTGRWLAAAVVGALPAGTLLWLTLRAGGRITPPARPGPAALAATPAELFGVAALAALLVALALFSLPLRRPAAVFTAWAVLPPLVLVLAARATPVWSAPWLLCTLPAWAALAAAALSRVRARWWAAVLAVIALVGAPAQAVAREPAGHGPDSRRLAATVAERLRPGDALVYGPDQAARDALAHYLPADRRPVDVPATGCVDTTGCLRGVRRVWVVRSGEWDDPVPATGGATERALRTRYHLAQRWRPAGFTLALLVDERPQL
jgi:mannosyltransferase